MKADIRFAVAGEDLQKRLRLACGLLQAHKIDGSLRAWDGTRCDCAIVAEGDLYGERVRSYALRKKIPVLVILPDSDTYHADSNAIGEQAPLNLYVRAVLNLLKARPQPVALVSSSVKPGLVMLAEAVSQQKGDVLAVQGAHQVQVRLSSGYIETESSEVLARVMDSLGQGDWRLQTLRAETAPAACRQSLDVFMVRAGILHSAQLPRFPVKGYRLQCWPDLGSAPDLIEPLRVASLLARGHRDLGRMAELTGISAERVSGILWGLQAAGLLVEDDRKMSDPYPETASNDRSSSGNLFQKLAARFGLFQKAS